MILDCNRKDVYQPTFRGGGRSVRLVRPSEESLNLTVIGPTKTLKIQGFVYKLQDFWSDQGRSGRTGSAGPELFTGNKALINVNMVQIRCSISQSRLYISKNPSVTRCSIWCRLANFSLHFKNRKKWILVMLSITVTCCTNIHILIRSPLKMKFLYLLWKFHGYIFNGLGEKWIWKLPPAILPLDLNITKISLTDHKILYFLCLSVTKNDTIFWFNAHWSRGIRKLIPNRGERYIRWAVPLYENEAKGTFFVSRLFLDSTISFLPGLCDRNERKSLM